MTTPTYRRARHSVSLLHAHLVFVTEVPPEGVHRRHAHVLPDHHARGLRKPRCRTSRIQLRGRPRHLLVAYPPTLAISQLVQRLKGRAAYALRREFTGACVRARMRGHLWSPSYFAVSCGGAPLSIIKQYIGGQARPL
jgi:putative transposase